jgi:hypothetical protein
MPAELELPGHQPCLGGDRVIVRDARQGLKGGVDVPFCDLDLGAEHAVQGRRLPERRKPLDGSLGIVDPFGPKAVRASMGSLFALPLSQCSDPLELRGTKVALATRGGKRPSNGLAGPAVLLVGSERDGLPRKLIDGADILWTFELDDGAESLNAASACSIALHVANRMPVE